MCTLFYYSEDRGLGGSCSYQKRREPGQQRKYALMDSPFHTTESDFTNCTSSATPPQNLSDRVGQLEAVVQELLGEIDLTSFAGLESVLQMVQGESFPRRASLLQGGFPPVDGPYPADPDPIGHHAISGVAAVPPVHAPVSFRALPS